MLQALPRAAQVSACAGRIFIVSKTANRLATVCQARRRLAVLGVCVESVMLNGAHRYRAVRAGAGGFVNRDATFAGRMEV